MEVIIGMAGALLAVILFALGAACGAALSKGLPTRTGGRAPASEGHVELTEDERKKREFLIKEQDAFRDMMRYNAETAYQMGGSIGGDGR